MIRFGAILTVVVVAMGLLAGGVLANSLLLVYLTIAVAAVAMVMLVAGVVIWRGEIFGGAADRAGEREPDASISRTARCPQVPGLRGLG